MADTQRPRRVLPDPAALIKEAQAKGYLQPATKYGPKPRRSAPSQAPRKKPPRWF